MPNLPYAQRTGTLESMLEKIKTASVPDTFSQDFVSTKLSMKGGTARSIIPFIKKMGFVTADGTPTERYRQFRNPAKSGVAIADSMRDLYSVLFEMNEYCYELGPKELRNLVVEATGAEPGAKTVEMTVSTFTALNKLADFEATADDPSDGTENHNGGETQAIVTLSPRREANPPTTATGMNLAYTINLNLPATTDVEVFNAIFKSLRQHLLEE